MGVVLGIGGPIFSALSFYRPNVTKAVQVIAILYSGSWPFLI